jgi:hypothetical protein
MEGWMDGWKDGGALGGKPPRGVLWKRFMRLISPKRNHNPTTIPADSRERAYNRLSPNYYYSKLQLQIPFNSQSLVRYKATFITFFG